MRKIGAIATSSKHRRKTESGGPTGADRASTPFALLFLGNYDNHKSQDKRPERANLAVENLDSSSTGVQVVKPTHSEPTRDSDTRLTIQVVNHIRAMIENGELKPGEKVPPEREFAQRLKISRASLRTGIGYMAAMGIMRVRHGVGTFIAEGPPQFGNSSLRVLGALHGFKSWHMFEARLLLESKMAGLAAERGKEEHFTQLAEEVAEMYATIDDPDEYLIHDVRFHRTIAAASDNPILASLMETVTSALYDGRRKTVSLSRSLKDSADIHREIYRAIRRRDSAAAQELMARHIESAKSAQDDEERMVSPKPKRVKTNGRIAV
jgi:GntR family transcriptional regulator, transcriptional repressor for pyruvate dehydrogenase complex